MKIRTLLTLQFLFWGTLIMTLASFTIYYSSANFRKDDFYNRLKNKSRSTAKMLFDAKSIDPERVHKIEKDNPINLQNEKIIILNFLNDVVYSTDSTNEIQISNSVLERVRLMETVTFRQGDYQVTGSLYTAKLDRFVLIAAAIDIEGKYHLGKLKLILFVVFILSLFLFSAAGWLYSGRALRPISDITGKAEEISITSLNLRVPVINESDEIGRLAKTVNKMLDRLELSFVMQKNFISNASHELRTPLTAINGHLEVLSMKSRTEEEYKTGIDSILEDTRSLINLLNRLLMIAKTSSDGYVIPNKKVRIDEILWQAKDEIRKFNDSYKINISLDVSIEDADQMIVLGDESMLKVALSNIIENGCKYSADHTVNVFVAIKAKNIKIEFADRGIGVSKEEIGRIFEPFYRASNAKSYPGTGIGLQLVSQIVKGHNGSIDISSEIDLGTTVRMSFPFTG